MTDNFKTIKTHFQDLYELKNRELNILEQSDDMVYTNQSWRVKMIKSDMDFYCRAYKEIIDLEAAQNGTKQVAA